MSMIEAQTTMKESIQKVATGPEYSKNLSFDEAHRTMTHILTDAADPVQAAVFLIALRMKRETIDEYKGVLQALQESAIVAEAPVDEVFDIADPYDGHNRGLPMAAFIAPVLAACGVAAVSHGLESLGPKYGATQRKILAAAGVNVELTPQQAAARLAPSEAGWAYVDQQVFCPKLHGLLDLRSRIIKRQILTTVETLLKPVRGKKVTRLLTGYVHKAYPPIYSELARFAGFDSAMVVRGVEGGVIPSLQQAAKLFYYHDKAAEQVLSLDPAALGIEQKSRAVPLPKTLAANFNVEAAAELAAQTGIDALQGKTGPARDSLVYSTALCLHHMGKYESLRDAADAVRTILDSGKALENLRA